MIRATDLGLRRGTKVLLSNTQFVINPKERVGVVGRNGAGKSTLFALFQHLLDADSGTLTIPSSWRIASVDQEIRERDRPAREFVIDGDVHLRSLQAERAATPDEQGEDIARLENALIEADAWTAASRAEQLLAGLGFKPDQWLLPVGQFSGGWQMRIALARALMAPSDLLLLDEPTNHLDLDAMLWLERWLQSYPGTVLTISHDTEFLDAVSTHILHFEQQQLTKYRGNYSAFLSQRAERLRQDQLAWEKQQREVAHLQSFIDRFKAKATKAKQAQSRVKALAKMQELAPVRLDGSVQFSLPTPEHMPDPLLRLIETDLGYSTPEKKIILRQVSVDVRSGSRIGILGMNGAGKSTLIKTLAGEIAALNGELVTSARLEVGYFAQHQLDMIEAELSPIQHMQRIAPDVREQELRNYLGRFAFSGEMATDTTAGFSGGEKARLALALIVWHKPNLLLLDEPTNHLDVETREALAAALAEYEGSVLVVSHDRQLLRSTVDNFWIVADGQVAEFDGDLEDYRDWLLGRAAQLRSAKNLSSETNEAEPTVDRRTQRRLEAEARQKMAHLRKPLEKKIQQLEKHLEQHKTRLIELDELMSDPAFYGDQYKEQRPALLAEHGEISKQIDQHEEQWLDLLEQIEQIEAEYKV
ncbi:ATP-binding cassette domain-containing protein [Paenalcaligenes hominis]|uniref:ATP-binding cassette subfamily F protein 3 n=1 Tax=Paenalcaligenes hominis TaxID=643674 RepID=A0ABX0WLW4_9BURK|nr:ATP-binding cassette domain-containing protein [Paenalcaligenes hominis]NJB64224.1 ATP-binding cassette subfamily F protein 3 [Paenalcaligenes hominis]GGE69272.1 ABC transporter ATP-binding protein [Paenalcaligenes hominis]